MVGAPCARKPDGARLGIRAKTPALLPTRDSDDEEEQDMEAEEEAEEMDEEATSRDVLRRDRKPRRQHSSKVGSRTGRPTVGAS